MQALSARQHSRILCLAASTITGPGWLTKTKLADLTWRTTLTGDHLCIRQGALYWH